MIEDVCSAIPDVFDATLMRDIKQQIESVVPTASRESDDENPKAVPPTMEIQPFEHYDYVLLMFKDSRDWMNFTSMFPVEKRHFALRDGSVKRVGDCRVLDGSKFLGTLAKKIGGKS
jgi:hypothetical protein